MRKLIHFLWEKTNFYTFLVSILIFIFFLIVVLPNEQNRSYEMTNETRSPDTSFFYRARDLYEIASSYEEEGRAYYIQSRFSFDIVWPLAYTSFLVFTPLYIFKKTNKKYQYLIIFSLLAMLFDFLENSFASIVMARYPKLTPGIAHITPLMTMLKWITLSIAFLVLLYAITIYLNQFFKRFIKALKY
jgi:hypothetical protein